MDKKILIGLIVIIAVIALFVVRGSLTGNVVADSSESISIPLSEITEQAKFYEYDSGGKTLRFFAIRAENGSVKTAFDACDVCYGSGKGYRQEGDYMVCNNCGNKYPISGLGTKNLKGGGCWPGYLPSSIEGDNLIIKTSDLAKGEYRF